MASSFAEKLRLLVLPKLVKWWLLTAFRLLSEDDIQFLFSRFGVIANARVDEEVGKAFIEFSAAQAVDNLRKKKFNHIIELVE